MKILTSAKRRFRFLNKTEEMLLPVAASIEHILIYPFANGHTRVNVSPHTVFIFWGTQRPEPLFCLVKVHAHVQSDGNVHFYFLLREKRMKQTCNKLTGNELWTNHTFKTNQLDVTTVGFISVREPYQSNPFIIGLSCRFCQQTHEVEKSRSAFFDMTY